MRGLYTLGLVIAAATLGCDKAPAPAQAQPVKAASGGEVANPLASHGAAVKSARPAPAAGTSVAGTVKETMDSGGYTYVLLTNDSGQTWAAIRKTKVAIGDKITVVNAMVMRGFTSKTLNRTFDSIYFGNKQGADTQGGGGLAAATKRAAPAAGTSAVGKAASGALLKAAVDGGTHQVAALFAKKAELVGKRVTVKGKVVKFTAGIMGRNWVHLQDGTGAEAEGNHDLTLTTQVTVAKDAEVTFEGLVRTDKDFGAGYKYGLILEEAALK